MLWANLSFYISFLAKNIKRYEMCYSIHMGNDLRSIMMIIAKSYPILNVIGSDCKQSVATISCSFLVSTN